ncbi:glycosyltransferase family 39 protein [candidate division WOR-3 bacterium]|nr:glycosyltransferase family 39 protein [candidate division WOR-3 bacterium]
MARKPPSGRTTASTSRDRRIWLFAALALTFFIRLWFILGMRGHPFSTMGPTYVDSYYYHQWAIEIISGNFWGSDVFFLRPLYPYLLALIYAIFGRHVLAVQLVQTLFATASCFLLYETTRRIFGRRPAIFASFGFALTGVLVFFTGTFLHVELTVLLSLLFLWLILIAGRRIWLWAVAGICFGLLVISRPELLLVLPFLVAWLWKQSTTRGPSSDTPGPLSGVPRSAPVALAAVALLIIAVVPIRNYIVGRDPVLFTAHSGLNFYYANNPSADGTWQPTAELARGTGFSHERLKHVIRTIDGRQVSWSAASSYWTRRGISFITHQPGKYLQLLGRKLLLFFSNYEVPNNYYPETVRPASLPLRLAFVNFGLVLGLGLVGMVWAWPKRRQALPTYLFVAAHLVSALLFYVLSRLRAPVLPFLLMFAGYGLHGIVDSIRQRRVKHAVVGIAIAAAVYAASVLIPVPRQTYSAQAWVQAGNTWLGERKVGPAIEALNRALAIQPSLYAARYSLVMALAGSGRLNEAEAEFRKLQADATSPSARVLVLRAAVRLSVARREFARAVALGREALAADPNDAETHYMLGLVFISMDSLVQAREHLSRAAALEPGQHAIRDALQAVESRLQGR